MHYKTNRDLPSAVRNGLQDDGQTIYRTAYNAACDEFGKDRANAIAWTAVKRKYKKKDNAWVATDAAPDGIVIDDSIEFVEHFVLDEKQDKIVKTQSGYLTAMPRVARTGIYDYKGTELGRPDLDKVKVYISPEVLFDTDSMATLAHRPVTNDHSPVDVTAKNWKQYAVGSNGGDVARDGDCLRVSVLVMDQAAVTAVNNGKVELSPSYRAKLVWGDGVTPEGEEYQARQEDRHYNHLAIVDRARGGQRLRLGDNRPPQPEERKRTMVDRTIILDGMQLTLEDRDAAFIERYVKTLNDSVAKLTADNTQHIQSITTLQTSVQNKDAELVTVKKQLEDAKLTPQKLDEAVKARHIMLGAARAILGDALIIDGRTDADIRRQVVSHKLGALASNFSDEQCMTSFLTLARDHKEDDGRGQQRNNHDGYHRGPTVHDAAKDWGRPGYARGNQQDTAAKAYDDNVDYLHDAWKGEQPKQTQ